MNRRTTSFAALTVAALIGLVPLVGPTLSAALFTHTTIAGANVVTAGPCASDTGYASAVTGLATAANREVWQRMTRQSGTTLTPDGFQSRTWTSSGVVFGGSGALYCSDNASALLDDPTDSASTTSAQSYSTWGANGSLSLALWIRGTSTGGGRLVSLAEASSGSTAYVERALWVTTSGQLAIGGRYGSGTSSAWATTTAGAEVTDGRWHLIVVVMPNTATSNVAPTLLLDGVVLTTVTTGTVSYRARSSAGTTARWYVGDNNAGRLPTGAPSVAWTGEYDEFVVVSGTPSATALGYGAGSLYRAADS